MILSIAESFSRYPAGRYPSDGPYNGQRFRDQFLRPALQQAASTGDRLVVVLDGVIGYSSSFLEEAFGGLIRATDVSPETIKATLEIRADDIAYRPAKIDAERYLDEELARKR